MAEASQTVEVSVSREKLWKVITDYESYPKFVDGVSSVKVISRENGKLKAEYKIELLGKNIVYVLDHTEQGPERMHWTMVESNIFKSNMGGWTLRELGPDRTEVTYRLAIEFKVYVPGMVLNSLVKSSLPKMIASFDKRAKEL